MATTTLPKTQATGSNLFNHQYRVRPTTVDQKRVSMILFILFCFIDILSKYEYPVWWSTMFFFKIHNKLLNFYDSNFYYDFDVAPSKI